MASPQEAPIHYVRFKLPTDPAIKETDATCPQCGLSKRIIIGGKSGFLVRGTLDEGTDVVPAVTPTGNIKRNPDGSVVYTTRVTHYFSMDTGEMGQGINFGLSTDAANSPKS